MPPEQLDPWTPLPISRIVDVFAAAPFRWWIGGGMALELHLDRSWRGHHDADVGIVRQDLPVLRDLLSSWDLHVAAGGALSPWKGELLNVEEQQNNVWCRRSENEPWLLDLTIAEGSSEYWIYRRDPAVRVRWQSAVLRTPDGVPYLAPDLQLLFKSKNIRPQDDIDAEAVIPSLSRRERAFLRRRLETGHPWQRWL